MTDRPLSREERLAAKLRENLRLRKAQSRQMAARALAAGAASSPTPALSKDGDDR